MRSNFKMEDEYIKMVRGDTLSFGFEITDSEDIGIEIDSAFFTCKQNFTDDMNVFKKTLGNGITAADLGQYIVRVAPEDTASAEAGKYFYDLQIGVGSDIYTILKGVLELEQDTTN